MKKSLWKKINIGEMFLLMFLLSLLIPVSHTEAATGDHIRLINGAYSRPCSVNTGLAFDGTDLLVSCHWHNVIDRLSSVDGSLQGTITVPGYSGLNAAAWDASRNKLWICAETYKVLLVDTSDGSSTYMFNAPNGCMDGLAYDGTDDSLWTSGDVVNTVYHSKTDGTFIAAHSIGGLIGGRCGNSGIAVGGQQLYLANNGCSEIYEVSKDFSSSSLFASYNERLEDMECDDTTFASQGINVMWSGDAYDRKINAYEIPWGSCRSGGGDALNLSKTSDVDDGDCVFPGDLITYQICFDNTNNPNDPITSVTLSDDIPADTTYVSATGPYAFNGGSVLWDFGTIPAGDPGQCVELVVEVAPSATPGQDSIVNTSIITGDDIRDTEATEYTDVCEPPEICGDLDGDGDVDMDDFNLFRSTLFKRAGEPGYIAGADFDGDGYISYTDYREWYLCYRDYLGI